MKLMTILTFIMISSVCYAGPSSDTLLHDTAHFGGVFAITDVTETVCTKIEGKQHKLACTIAGIALGNAANLAYKANEKFPSDTNRSLTAGALGSAAAAATITIGW